MGDLYYHLLSTRIFTLIINKDKITLEFLNTNVNGSLSFLSLVTFTKLQGMVTSIMG